MAFSLELLPGPEGITLRRNGKPLLTPARQTMLLPNEAVAQAVVREWEGLTEEKIDPLQLPVTGFAALALDVVGPQRAEITEELLDYGETDLLVYREGEDIELRRQQDRLWQPCMDWAVQEFGAIYQITYGVTPVAQDPRNRSLHRAVLKKYDIWQLACLTVVVKCSASLLLGLGFMARILDAQRVHELARLEEAHNTARWGEEEEAVRRGLQTLAELENARKWRDLLLTELPAAAT